MLRGDKGCVVNHFHVPTTLGISLGQSRDKKPTVRHAAGTLVQEEWSGFSGQWPAGSRQAAAAVGGKTEDERRERGDRGRCGIVKASSCYFVSSFRVFRDAIKDGFSGR
jgi:hypothetical protein